MLVVDVTGDHRDTGGGGSCLHRGEDSRKSDKTEECGTHIQIIGLGSREVIKKVGKGMQEREVVPKSCWRAQVAACQAFIRTHEDMPPCEEVQTSVAPPGGRCCPGPAGLGQGRRPADVCGPNLSEAPKH